MGQLGPLFSNVSAFHVPCSKGLSADSRAGIAVVSYLHQLTAATNQADLTIWADPPDFLLKMPSSFHGTIRRPPLPLSVHSQPIY